jgi:hypothetical protein
LQIVDFRFQIENPSTTAFQSAIENLKSASAWACEEVRDRRQGESSLPPAAIKGKQKGEHHASCKTRNQTPRQTQKDIGPRKRLLPY